MMTIFYKTNPNRNRIVRSFRLLFVGCWLVGVVVKNALAQNCADGSPFSNQTFGTGQRGALPNGYISYTYVNDGCPNDGNYTVAGTVSGACFTNSWHGLNEDHTPGDAAGNMLIINAPYPGEIYRETIAGLCTKAAYEYSFWLVNLNLEFPPGTCGFAIPNDPDITIRIETTDGRLIDTLHTGVTLRTPTPVWRKFAMTFSFPPMPEETTDVVIRLIDNGQGGCGNDFALDDLVLKRCTDCESPSVYVPDIFTPNNDGQNDVLDVFMSNVAAFEFVVYDRWGSAVFVSRDPTVKWDGKFKNVACLEGVYAWSMTYTFTTSTQKYTKNGQVVLAH